MQGGDKCGSLETITSPPNAPSPSSPPCLTPPLEKSVEICSHEGRNSSDQQGALKGNSAPIFAFGANCPVFDA